MSTSALKLKRDDDSAPATTEREKIASRWLPVLSDVAICFAIMVVLAQVYLRGQAGGAPLQSGIWLAMFVVLVAVRLGRHLIFRNDVHKLPLPVVVLGGESAAKGLCDVFKHASGHLRVIQQTHGSGQIRAGIVVVPAVCDAKTVALVEKSAKTFNQLYVAPQIDGEETTASAVLDDNARLRIHVGECWVAAEKQSIKRVLDVCGALLGAIAALPFVLLIALAIRLTSRGPVLFRQLRIGRGNRMFYALKFRTMFVDSSDRLNHYLENDPAMRVQWESVHKLKEDPRVTGIGRFLRRFSLDELPQIWNVLAGDMSLIGPRPIVISEIERYGLDYEAYEAVRPGLTGLWQVSGRNDTTYQERVNYDSYYVRNWSLRLDLHIIARTFRAVISGTGAY